MTGHSHHQKRHDDITARLTAWTWYRKPHALQQTCWSLNDHLRCCHGVRRHGQKTPGPIGRLVDLHAQLHQVTR